MLTIQQTRLRGLKSELYKTYKIFEQLDNDDSRKLFRAKIEYLLKQIQELEPTKTLEEQEAIAEEIELYN